MIRIEWTETTDRSWEGDVSELPGELKTAVEKSLKTSNTDGSTVNGLLEDMNFNTLGYNEVAAVIAKLAPKSSIDADSVEITDVYEVDD